MKKLTSNFAFFALLFTLFCSVANAQIVYNGTIFRTGGDPVGSPAVGSNVNSSLDYFPFSVLSAGNVTFDLLALELDNGGMPVELFADGRTTLIDIQFVIFVDDGMLDIGDFVDGNDDDLGGMGSGDGSVNILDSYLDVNLNPGNYTIAIGQFPLSVGEALAGEQLGKFAPAELDINGNFVVAPNVPYRLTITGDVFFPAAAVPEPGTVALLVGMASVGGLVLLHRRK